MNLQMDEQTRVILSKKAYPCKFFAKGGLLKPPFARCFTK